MEVKDFLSKVPPKVKVGTVTYAIAVVNDLTAEDGDHVNGYCQPQLLKVSLEEKHASTVTAVDTMIHELLHAIWDERGLPKKPDEERAVRTLATGLVGLFQDNPKLLTWIKRGLK